MRDWNATLNIIFGFIYHRPIDRIRTHTWWTANLVVVGKFQQIWKDSRNDQSNEVNKKTNIEQRKWELDKLSCNMAIISERSYVRPPNCRPWPINRISGGCRHHWRTTRHRVFGYFLIIQLIPGSLVFVLLGKGRKNKRNSFPLNETEIQNSLWCNVNEPPKCIKS